jgi:hypothetical protein
MFDIFYKGPKPGLFPFELAAETLKEAARLSRTEFFWFIDGHNDYTGFDFDFRPAPWQMQYVHIWPSQWQQCGGTYFSNKQHAKNRQWHFNTLVVKRLPDTTNWFVPKGIDTSTVDYTWHPSPLDPPYIYHFPSQWQSASGVTYKVSGATEIKLVDNFVVTAMPNKDYWIIPEEVNSTHIDFSWHPNPLDPPYIYHFGTEFQSSIGLTYTVPGATEISFAGPIASDAVEILDIFFIDKSNISSKQRYENLLEKYPNMHRVRYANTMIDTIKRCASRSSSNKFWVISSENIYDDFNFAWHAEPWQSYMTHVFGSQHQKWSDTYLINRWEFERTVTWANSLEEFPNLNFVQDQSILIPDDLYDIYFVDHGNENDQLTQLQKKYSDIKSTRYVDNYLDTFRRIMTTASTEYVWIISSLCDYTRFDFSWQPEPWQREMIHVFPSADQARGDTFYIHVESFKLQMVKLELLDWFNVINYCEEQRVPRLPIPVHEYQGDNLINAIKSHDFKHPYTWFFNHDRGIQYNPSIWYAKDRQIVGFSAGNSYILAPRDAKSVINTQAYDYPYITKMSLFDETPLDIIYVSYNESIAETNYQHLVQTSKRSIKRVDNVTGRVAAYHAAANLSETDWFFLVPAKLEVNKSFDWAWQPDYLQQPRHYIFNAKNPVNGLEYGHMAVIAYNKKLVLETDDTALDFALSKCHTVVPLLSGIARYDTDPLIVWRTAFRETLKLKESVDKDNDIESNYRLTRWLTSAQGIYANWSIRGAEDAVEYYNLANGDYNKLMKSFDWAWLAEYYAKKYNS